jgi:NAD-dependent deacetylase
MRSSALERIRPASDASIVVLTGAGVSKESGLDTFRDADGIWSKVRIEDVATYEDFVKDPRRVHDFYNQRRRGLLDPRIRPNAAHVALARLERDWPGEVLVITQNIDDLHERAGSRNLLHMHGELLKAECEHCRQVHVWPEDLTRDTRCPHCGRAAGMRPHVVWFGEMPLEMDRIDLGLRRAGLFVSIGTSGNVYPAAGFVADTRARGTPSIELNLEPSEGASLFTQAMHGPATPGRAGFRRRDPETVGACLRNSHGLDAGRRLCHGR